MTWTRAVRGGPAPPRPAPPRSVVVCARARVVGRRFRLAMRGSSRVRARAPCGRRRLSRARRRRAHARRRAGAARRAAPPPRRAPHPHHPRRSRRSGSLARPRTSRAPLLPRPPAPPPPPTRPRLASVVDWRARDRAAGLAPVRVPRHVAVIMDGNARWARARLPVSAGHERGVDALRLVVRCCRAGPRAHRLRVFARKLARTAPRWTTSTVLETSLTRELPDLAREGARAPRASSAWSPRAARGDRGRQIARASARTCRLRRAELRVSPRRRARRARAVAEAAAGLVDADDVTEGRLRRARPARGRGDGGRSPRSRTCSKERGESRLSNFMLWELACTSSSSPTRRGPSSGSGDERRDGDVREEAEEVRGRGDAGKRGEEEEEKEKEKAEEEGGGAGSDASRANADASIATRFHPIPRATVSRGGDHWYDRLFPLLAGINHLRRSPAYRLRPSPPPRLWLRSPPTSPPPRASCRPTRGSRTPPRRPRAASA